MSKNLCDLLVPIRSEVGALVLAIPIIKHMNTFSNPEISDIIERYSTTDWSISMHSVIRALKEFAALGILEKTKTKGRWRYNDLEFRFAKGTEKYKQAAVLAFDYTEGFGESLQSVIGKFHLAEWETGLEDWIDILSRLRNARTSRSGYIPRRRYVTISSLYRDNLCDVTLRARLIELEKDSYIKLVKGCSEMGIFYKRSLEYLRNSKSNIDDAIFEYLMSGKVYPPDCRIHDYLVDRGELSRYAIKKGRNRDRVKQRIGQLKNKEYYRKLHIHLTTEILLTLKGKYFMDNFFGPLRDIENGKGKKFYDERRAYLATREHFAPAVDTAVRAFGEATNKL